MTSADSRYPIRDVFQKFTPIYLGLHPNLCSEKRKAANSIMRCKTGQLGYNVQVCENCGGTVIHSVSCNNRYCPCCQSSLAKKWESERNTELIEGLAYYHVVFTVPQELNILIKFNMKLLLNLLFSCVHDTLLTLCADTKFMGATPGIVSVLHTWGQKLNFHPHIHVCLSGGGITPSGQFIETKHKGFILPEAVVADMFRGKYLCALKELYKCGKLILPDGIGDWSDYIDFLFSKRWLPFVKETFNGKGNAIRYLARYSYRTAISNSRIVSVDTDTVSFRYKDYASRGEEKIATISGVEFLDRFLMHILPRGFHRRRFAGYLSPCRKAEMLKLIHRLRNSIYKGNSFSKMKTADLLLELYGTDICVCPVCSGRLVFRARASPWNS
ncbi:MAG: transposase [Bacteroidales bacterium]|nr:transposase [Bacteroidales bacterium]